MPAAHDGRTFYRTWIVVAINLIQFQHGLSLSQFLHDYGTEVIEQCLQVENRARPGFPNGDSVRVRGGGSGNMAEPQYSISAHVTCTSRGPRAER